MVFRVGAVREYIERDASPLGGLVRMFYPQGSMAIRATIRSRKREDGFDIDLPPLKWSSLRYVLTMEDEIDGEEAAYGRRGCREASAG